MERAPIREERVVFQVDSVDVVGLLRIPLGAHATAGLVFAGPMTSVKEQATGNYAVAMAARGFVTLTFDHRHFGESEGFPRQYEHPGRKTQIVPGLALLRRATQQVRRVIGNDERNLTETVQLAS